MRGGAGRGDELHRGLELHAADAAMTTPMRVAICGSGPAGFYTAKYLLREFPAARVDLLEKLPTPFGLVRFGVAPDHPEVKAVQGDFSSVAQDERVYFAGNVSVGGQEGGLSLSLSDLMRCYHAVVFATGADSSRSLGVPGEGLRGVLSARDFVGWYNGHPDFVHLTEEVSGSLSSREGSTAVVVGVGNVALDCARILAKGAAPSVDALDRTDIAEHALRTLGREAGRRIIVAGRRGHVQAAFTIKELRELTKLKGSTLSVRAEELDLGRADPLSAEALAKDRRRQRVDALLQEAARAVSGGSVGRGRSSVELRFLQSPSRLLESTERPGWVGGVELERNTLVGGRASGTGQFQKVECGLVLSSIGYRSVPIQGLPFDHQAGILPNDLGRVQGFRGSVYCAGWLKRGPSGIIGTNIVDAKGTVAAIAEDVRLGHIKGLDQPRSGWSGLPPAVRASAVDWDGFRRIEEAERARGAAASKPREKIVSLEELLRAAEK